MSILDKYDGLDALFGVIEMNAIAPSNYLNVDVQLEENNEKVEDIQILPIDRTIEERLIKKINIKKLC